MLNNEKSILVYGANEEELEKFKSTGIKIIKVTDEMLKMKVRDIISGLKFNIVSINNIREKVVLFNNLSDEELNLFISRAKDIVENPILAIVTPKSREWEFGYLVKHLQEEREWHRYRQKGRP